MQLICYNSPQSADSRPNIKKSCGDKKRTSENDMTFSRSGKHLQREAEPFFDLCIPLAMFFHWKKLVDQISNSPAQGSTLIHSITPIKDEDENENENKNQNKDAHDNNDNDGYYLDNNPTKVQTIPRSTAPASINSQFVILSACSALHQSSKTMFLNKQPPAKVTWKTFGNIDSYKYFSSAANLTEYHNCCCRFHARFIIIYHCFFVDKLKNIFNATMSSFIHEAGLRNNQLQASKCFYDTYDLMQDNFISKFHSYARSWLQTTGEKDYATRFVNGK